MLYFYKIYLDIVIKFTDNRIFLYSKYRLQVQKVLIHPQYQQFQRQKTISPFDMAVLVMKPHSKFEYPENFLQIQWDYSPQDYPQSELKFLTFKETKQSKLKLMEANHNKIEQADQWLILYKNTTYEGDSGSLILLWKRKENQYKVVGIHIGEQRKSNYGILLTTKSHSPKDIFSQMIEYNLQLQQNQKIRNNSSQLKNSDLQMKKESSAIQIMTQLKQQKNYYLSTQNYIKQLEYKNRKLKREVKQQKQFIQKQLHIKDTPTPDKLDTSLNNKTQKNISFHQQQEPYLDNKETPKKDYNKVQPKSISSNQFTKEIISQNQEKKESISSESINQQIQVRGDENKNEATKGQTQKNNLQKGKQSETKSKTKSKTKKLNKKQQNQQYNCLAEMCKIFTNWLSRRPAKITNGNESSVTIMQE